MGLTEYEQKLFDEGMALLKDQKARARVKALIKKGQDAGKGNWGFWTEQDQREEDLECMLKRFLARLYLKSTGRMANQGLDHQKCAECRGLGYNVDTNQWMCQEICENK